jgi:hypothetical protein
MDRLSSEKYDLPPGEALEIAPADERSLHARGGNLEHVPLRKITSLVEKLLKSAADDRTIIDSNALAKSGIRPIDPQAEDRPGFGASAFELDQLEPQPFNLRLDIALKRIGHGMTG